MNPHLKNGLSIWAFALFVTLTFAYAVQGVALTPSKLGVTLIICLAMGALWGAGANFLAKRKHV